MACEYRDLYRWRLFGKSRPRRLGGDLRFPQFPVCAIGVDHRLALGDVVAAVQLKAPAVEHGRQVIDIGIVAGEIKIDHPDVTADKQHIVGKIVGMDHAAGQVFGPAGNDFFQRGIDQRFQSVLDRVGVMDGFGERPPALGA